MTNGLLLHITVEESTSKQWVKHLKHQYLKIIIFANSIEPDESAHYEPYMDLHCLPSSL